VVTLDEVKKCMLELEEEFNDVMLNLDLSWYKDDSQRETIIAMIKTSETIDCLAQ
jgi:hypothetical protein